MLITAISFRNKATKINQEVYHKLYKEHIQVFSIRSKATFGRNCTSLFSGVMTKICEISEILLHFSVICFLTHQNCYLISIVSIYSWWIKLTWNPSDFLLGIMKDKNWKTEQKEIHPEKLPMHSPSKNVFHECI